MAIQVEVRAGHVAVKAPYHSEFVVRARAMGGKWDGESWIFAKAIEANVRDVCREIYADDGTVRDVVTLRVSWTKAESDEAIQVRGWTIARDGHGRVLLGDGVSFVVGIPASKGSRRSPWVAIPEGAVAIIREFPRAQAEELVLSQPDKGRECSIEQTLDREALIAEKERLLKRLAEIDQLLAE